MKLRGPRLQKLQRDALVDLLFAVVDEVSIRPTASR
jgi:hypothetical protein